MIKDIYIILGAPGTGKIIQSILLSERLNLEMVSLGKMMNEKSLKDELVGKKFTDDIEREKLISKLIKHEIQEKIKNSDKDGLIIGGYPRRLSEAKWLKKLIQDLGLNTKCVININTSLSTVADRMKDNLICPKCGRVYNQVLIPKQKLICDLDGSILKPENFSFKDLKNDFDQFINENRETYYYLAKLAQCYFTVSGDNQEIDLFSEIILKIRDGKRECDKEFERQSTARLETDYGEFTIITYMSKIDYSHHIALVKGDVKNKTGVLVRVHSSCITGDIFASKRCDCGPQLHLAMKRVQKEGCGIVIYLFQEGRGINIVNKINAYALQQKGLDTVDANERLGLQSELRRYDVVKDILVDLDVRSIRLMTNNPDKVSKLTDLGIAIEGIEHHEVKATKFSARYLKTKRDRMGHTLKVKI